MAVPSKRPLPPVRHTWEYAVVAVARDQVRIDLTDEDGNVNSAIRDVGAVRQFILDLQRAATDAMRMDV
jgi:hypothetical protein